MAPVQHLGHQYQHQLAGQRQRLKSVEIFQGSFVVFDNTPAANQTINIAPASVSPGSLTFNNTSLVNYTIGGGAIAGTTGVTIQGNGTETFTGNNTYTGATSISSGGTLSVASESGLGAVPVALDAAILSSMAAHWPRLEPCRSAATAESSWAIPAEPSTSRAAPP